MKTDNNPVIGVLLGVFIGIIIWIIILKGFGLW